MQKTLILFALMIHVNIPTFAQDNKEKLADLIETSTGWMNSYTVEKLFTINLSPTMWESVLAAPSQPRGRDSFKRMAQALVDFSDKAGYTSLNEKCGFNVQSDKAKEWQPTCKEQIDRLASKLTFKYEAADVAKNPTSFNLAMGYLTTIADFFNARSSYITNGWRPKGEKLNIVLSPSDKATGINVAWSPDGQTVTVSGPANKEVPGWNDAILNGLAKGGKK
ncbi:hypothetical protein IC229_33825 [Spirosoma sp. BT702]|uniref:Uncharacterized protein n=1 Tax=Spirosoma profusum TaxID=2771354 RepID=A0A927GAK0_9BACT|nr:hypothetical protein [Spirosoma profusum]MBD2705637.1 hypothetical protein [Spirosoma profusum]